MTLYKLFVQNCKTMLILCIWYHFLSGMPGVAIIIKSAINLLNDYTYDSYKVIQNLYHINGSGYFILCIWYHFLSNMPGVAIIMKSAINLLNDYIYDSYKVMQNLYHINGSGYCIELPRNDSWGYLR